MVQKTMQEAVENYEVAAQNLISSNQLASEEISTGYFFRGNNIADFISNTDEFNIELREEGLKLKKDFKEEFRTLEENYYNTPIQESTNPPKFPYPGLIKEDLVKITHDHLKTYKNTGEKAHSLKHLKHFYKDIDQLPKSKHLIKESKFIPDKFSTNDGKIVGMAVTGGLTAGYGVNLLLGNSFTGSEEAETLNSFFSIIGGTSATGMIGIGLELYAQKIAQKYNSVMDTAQKIQGYATMFSKDKTHKS